MDKIRKTVWNQKAYIEAISTMWLLYRDMDEEEYLLEDEDAYGEQADTDR